MWRYVELGTYFTGLVGVKRRPFGQSTTNASPRDHIQQKSLTSIKLSALSFIILMGPSEAIPKIRGPSLTRWCDGRTSCQCCSTRSSGCQHGVRTCVTPHCSSLVHRSICHVYKILSVLTCMSRLTTQGKNRCGRTNRRECLGGWTSFSHSWSVLSPSFPVCPASVPSFPGSPSLKHKRWGEI